VALSETSFPQHNGTSNPALPSASPQLASVAELARPVAWAADRLLPVRSQIRGLFPDGGLRRGSTIVVSGSTSLALTTMAAASAEGSWCAAVGFSSLGLVAAAELGIELGRFALIPSPSRQWAVVVAALLDALDVVLVRPPTSVSSSDARRLASRARERGSVLVPVVDDNFTWPQSDLHLRCQGREWQGVGNGHGYLRKQRMRIEATGRGAASRPRQALVALAAS